MNKPEHGQIIKYVNKEIVISDSQKTSRNKYLSALTCNQT